MKYSSGENLFKKTGLRDGQHEWPYEVSKQDEEFFVRDIGRLVYCLTKRLLNII